LPSPPPQSGGGQNAECRGANLQTSATAMFDEATYARLRHGHPRGRSSEPTFHRLTSSRTPPPH